MSGVKRKTKESDWTKANLQKLLAAMKTNIPEHDRNRTYFSGMKAMNWIKVAFPPFSPKACETKWREILQNMRKTRTLTELIVEAEEDLSSPLQNNKQGKECTKDADGLPRKPPVNGYNLFCKEQLGSMASVKKNAYVSVWAQRWRDLTESQRDEYNARCSQLKRQYKIELSKYLKTLNDEKQQWILNKYCIKRPKVHVNQKKRKVVKKFPGEPKMPSRSVYLTFCKEQMELLKEEYSNPRERLHKIIQLWNHITSDEKICYQEKLRESMRTYLMELQKWFKTLTPAEQKDYRMHNSCKWKYLDAKPMEVCDKEECVCRPSDSEDEDIEDSSSDEENDALNCEEDKEEEEEEEEEEEDDDITFDMY